jgi:hypothetical protein
MDSDYSFVLSFLHWFKGVIRSRKSKKDRQYRGVIRSHQLKDRQYKGVIRSCKSKKERQYRGVIRSHKSKKERPFIDLRLLITPLYSFLLWFTPFCLPLCIVFPSLIYGFWLPFVLSVLLWLATSDYPIVLSFLLWFTASDYPFVLSVLLWLTASDYPFVLSVLLWFTASDYPFVLAVLLWFNTKG